MRLGAGTSTGRSLGPRCCSVGASRRRQGCARVHPGRTRPRVDRLGAERLVRLSGLGSIYIEPGSPWENLWIESFNGRTRDELLNLTEFGSVTEASVILVDWRNEYNTWCPYSSLRGLTPAEYAAQYRQTNQLALP